MLNKLLNLLFPEPCPICKGTSNNHKTAPICSDCWGGIKPYNGSSCRICGTPLASKVSSACGECLKDKPPFRYARSFGLHEETMKKAISLFKFYGIKRLSGPLSDKLINMKLPEADQILPVPLHKKRLREREFNQSALLGKYTAKHLGIPLNHNSLIRNRETVPQVSLSAKERKKNIRNAFTVMNGDIKGKRLILIDDVFTTGATVRECSRVLKKAGAEDVIVITLTHGTLD